CHETWVPFSASARLITMLPIYINFIVVRAAARIKDLNDRGEIVVPRGLLQNGHRATAAPFASRHRTGPAGEIAVDRKIDICESRSRRILRLNIRTGYDDISRLIDASPPFNAA